MIIIIIIKTIILKIKFIKKGFTLYIIIVYIDLRIKKIFK